MASALVYSRLTNISAGTTETRLLPGTQGTDYRGSPTLVGNSLSVGDVFVVRAWGQYTADGSQLTARFRLYLNFGGGASQILLADTGAIQVTSDTGNYEWGFEALVTIRSSGSSGTLWADAICFNRGVGSAAGILAYSTNVDTTANNTFELTGVVSNSVTLSLRQAVIEKVA